MDANHWVKPMETELEFMYSNKVLTLIEAPNDNKPIGCKWGQNWLTKVILIKNGWAFIG